MAVSGDGETGDDTGCGGSDGGERLILYISMSYRQPEDLYEAAFYCVTIF